MTISLLKKSAMLLLSVGAVLGAVAAEGDAWLWPAYSPTLNYNFKDQGKTYAMPTKNHDDCGSEVVGTIDDRWWTFQWGSTKNSLVTDAAIRPMLERFNEDFNYIRDTMGWPPDSRVRDGYRSAIYLYGSIPCSGSTNPEDKGGWQSWVGGYPAVVASYYPVYSFDPSCPYNDKVSQQGAMIHEGIHSLLATMGGASHVHWFQEGGNTWLQQEMEARRGGNYTGMGFLNAGPLIAPFVPIESYSGWLLDGSFGGPGAEGVDVRNGSQQLCNWRNMLGGIQYGNLFPTFLAEWVNPGAIPWIWTYTKDRSKYILHTMSDTLGDAQIRRLIMEYRAKLAMLDMKKWSNEMKNLLNQNFGTSIACEWEPCAATPASWKMTPYVVTTESNGVLTPENRTTPGWSGANVIPLTVSGSTVKLELQPIGDNLSLQICYRATDGTPVYSEPVMGSAVATLKITKTPQSNVVFAVVANTDYKYLGDDTRKKHHDYRLKLTEGVSGAADPYTKWYNNFSLTYDWDAVSHVGSSSSGTGSSSSSAITSSSSVSITTTEISHNVEVPISSNYASVNVNLETSKIEQALGITASQIASQLDNGLTFYGVNADGSLYNTSTANAPGHWFDASGNVVSYSDNAILFSEFDVQNMKMNIGHYPNKVTAGAKYTISQALIYGTKKVVIHFQVSIESKTTIEKSIASADFNAEKLNISYDHGVIVAYYQVPVAGKVKVSLYTAYGALITHLVNTTMDVGSYTKRIDLKAMNIPQGTYLIKFSYPGSSETKVSITAPR